MYIKPTTNNHYTEFNKKLLNKSKESPTMLSYEQKMNILVPKTKEVLAETAEKQVPENGLFRKVFVSFSVSSPSISPIPVILLTYGESSFIMYLLFL